MKVPTMDQLRIQHELAMAGAHAEWEELWRQIRAYGMAYWMGKGASTETYGRGDALVITGFDPAKGYERWYRLADWDDSLVLEDFPRSALADAVAQSVEP
ncbi:hypothetical protein [Pseudomonas lactis]|uniref:hypothetical protein n=1 Tax=Pseudomonas lactis TaxID=1615674 RepID=UPI0019DFF75D|nr:hypothetical protein [Pseudomonas lactis]MBA6043850.1 hypothetical protein [Pseudomonas lactis]